MFVCVWVGGGVRKGDCPEDPKKVVEGEANTGPSVQNGKSCHNNGGHILIFVTRPPLSYTYTVGHRHWIFSIVLSIINHQFVKCT